MMVGGHKHRQLTWVFPATLQDIDTICLKMHECLIDAGIRGVLFEVELLVREALINAVVHGSRLDSHKNVELNLLSDEKELVIEVHDQGPGFDWKSRMNTEVKLSDESGRGLMILRNYSSDFKYNTEGNRLTLRKSIV